MAGKSRLVTHNDPLKPEIRLQNTGFLAAHDLDINHPIEGISIPNEFVLKNTGTRVVILGFDTSAYPNWKDEIIKSTAKHFFYAIHNQNLEVLVSIDEKSEEINNHTLESALNKCDDNENARWYYRCIRDETPEITKSSGQFSDMGNMRVWINTDDDAPKRLAHINRRGMFITDKRQFSENPFCPYGSAGWSPWCAVSMADSDATDSFIRKMEPPAHDAVEVKRLRHHLLQENATSELRFQRDEITKFIKIRINDSIELKSNNVDELAHLFPDISDLESEKTTSLKWRKKSERSSRQRHSGDDDGEDGVTVSDNNGSNGPSGNNGNAIPRGGSNENGNNEIFVLNSSRVMRTSSQTVALSLHLSDQDAKNGVRFALLMAGEQFVDSSEYLPIASANSESLTTCEVSNNVVSVSGIVCGTTYIEVSLKGEVPYTGYSVKKITSDEYSEEVDSTG